MADMEIDYKGNMADIDSILTDYLYLQEYRKEKAQEVLNYHQDLNNELGI